MFVAFPNPPPLIISIIGNMQYYTVIYKAYTQSIIHFTNFITTRMSEIPGNDHQNVEWTGNRSQNYSFYGTNFRSDDCSSKGYLLSQLLWLLYFSLKRNMSRNQDSINYKLLQKIKVAKNHFIKISLDVTTLEIVQGDLDLKDKVAE